MSERLVLLAAATLAASGVPGLFARRGGSHGQWLATFLACLGAALGILAVAIFWGNGVSEEVSFPSPISGVAFTVAMDGISALFLMPIFLVALLGSVYGLGYWSEAEHPHNGRKLRLFYGTLAAGMVVLVVARDSILFLFGWEIMALSAFFLVTTEDEKQEVREAGWIYLVATHVATLSLFALFALLRVANGSFALKALDEGSLSPTMKTAAFALALVGFGVKAGIMPLHVWLPSSHAIAPSHVSAIMSGVIIKMGIYGLVRITSLLPNPPPEWGVLVLALGVTSGVLGVAFAIGQHDIKRLLAYHSIENIGIIVMGLGLALLGRSLGQPDWIVLGLSGAFLHVWNHAMFKALLFLSAGSVIHATHTREIDHLGGLSRAMPWTSLCFLAGAVAICGLPPLNGFVSELLVYLGLFRTLGLNGEPSFLAAALAAPALALIGGLAAACFVKVFGAVFLGSARTEHAAQAHEAGPSMIGPMAFLVVACLFIGLAPALVAPALGKGVAAWVPGQEEAGRRLADLAPLGWVSVMGGGLLAALLLGGWILKKLLLRGVNEAGPTWGCGYAAPTPRMQYTSSSFAEMLVGLFRWALHPKTHPPKDLPIFPAKSQFHSEVPDTVLDRVVFPIFRGVAGLFSGLRVLQRGNIQMYLLYIFAILLALFLWR